MMMKENSLRSISRVNLDDMVERDRSANTMKSWSLVLLMHFGGSTMASVR